MPATLEDIRTVRAELQQFDAKQTDHAVRFHVAVVDANLRAASEGHDDPMFREGLAICVNDLAACVRNPGRGCGSAHCFFCEAVMKAGSQRAAKSQQTTSASGARSRLAEVPSAFAMLTSRHLGGSATIAATQPAYGPKESLGTQRCRG
jgi:hypothetical protein